MGSTFETLPNEIGKYIMKYGGESLPYFQCFVWKDEQDGLISLQRVKPFIQENRNEFVGDFQNEYDAVLEDEERFAVDGQEEYLKEYFTRLHNTTLTAVGNEYEEDLLLNVYVSLYDNKSFGGITKIIDTIKKLDSRYVVDVYGFASDLAPLLTSAENLDTIKVQFTKLKEQTRDMINEIAEYKKSNPLLSHLVVLQNSNCDNRALNLDKLGLLQVICEIVISGIEHYNDVFGINLSLNEEKPITVLGVSFVNLDKFFFVQYLLNRTYLYLMEREGIRQKTVDIQKVSLQQHRHIQNHLKVYNEFYEQEVRPLFEANKSQDEIASIIVPQMASIFETIEKDMKSYIGEENMSLPEKLGVMSMLVGEDNEMLSGKVFSYEYDTIDDLVKDPASFFIQENNKLIVRKKNNDTGKDIIIPGPLSTPIDEMGNVYLPIDELKSLKSKIRETTADIRKKEEMLEQLEGNIKSSEEKEKRLTENGFVYKGKTYRLVKSDIEETPLEKTYTPHNVSKTNVDLRPSFTSVKDQGQQGACSAFALIGIYEFILNKEKKFEYDLSESFLYYNARDLDNNLSVNADTGSSFYYCIKSLETLGVCSENDCPYDDSVFNKKPSDTAYNNAKDNMVAEAQNVELSVNAIKSALEDGFPVAVSFNLYDSFNPVNGFISRPTDQEIKEGANDDKNRRHAMVVCGFSDDQRVFIVRNSWGKTFGVNGYCYVPYSYVGDSKLVNAACIITQLCKSEINVIGCSNSTVVQFNQSDSEVESQIIRNLIGEMKFDLSEYVNSYKTVNSQYLNLIQNIGTAPKRADILKRTSERLQQEIHDLDAKVNDLRDKKSEKIEKLKLSKKSPIILFTIVGIATAVLAVLIFFLGSKISWIPSKVINWMGYVLYIVTVLSFIVSWALWHNYKTHIRNLNDDLDEAIERCAQNKKKLEKELDEKALNSRIAGYFIDHFLKLRKTMTGVYNAFDGYLGNLRVWYDSECDNVKSMTVKGKIPFIPLLSTSKLDEFFERKKEDITNGLNLYDYFDNASLDFSSKEKAEKAIVSWKNHIKIKTKEWLLDYISDFSILEYMLKEKSYDYLEETTDNQHKTILGKLENESKVFLQLNNPCEPVTILFTNWSNDVEKQNWMSEYKKYFSANSKPSAISYSCKDKITMIQVANIGLEEIKLMDVDK